MGASRISSALFDLKSHSAATTLQLNHQDGKSGLLNPFFLSISAFCLTAHNIACDMLILPWNSFPLMLNLWDPWKSSNA